MFLLDIEFWVDSSFYSSKMCCHFFLASMISNQKSPAIRIVFLPKDMVSVSCCFQDFPSSIFRTFTVMCFGMNFFRLVLFGILLAFWFCRFMSCQIWGFQPLFLLLLFLPSFSSQLRTHIRQMLGLCSSVFASFSFPVYLLSVIQIW